MGEEFSLQGHHVVADVTNFFRAVLGVGGLSMPFAFKQSGWLLAVCILIFITTATVCVAEMLIQCKYLTIKQICAEVESKEEGDGKDMLALEERLSRFITLKDIGQRALGSTLGAIFELCCIGSLFGIACNYHILFGNSLYHLIYGEEEAVNITSDANQTATVFLPKKPNDAILTAFVLLPLPLYIGSAFFREFRHFSLLSACTSLALILSITFSTIYSCIDFKLSDAQPIVEKTAIVGFVQQLTAFEVLPVILFLESSMKGNQHKFSLYIRLVLPLVGALTCFYGLIGYLRFGSLVPQMISSLFKKGPASATIDLLLVTVGLFAYAMPIQPCLEYVENQVLYTGSVNTRELPSELSSISGSQKGAPNLMAPRWKANTLRVSVVLVGALLAVSMKDLLAYLLAYIGALGGAPVLFIFPSACFIRLKVNISKAEWTANVVSIIFGTLMTIIGIVITTLETVAQVNS